MHVSHYLQNKITVQISHSSHACTLRQDTTNTGFRHQSERAWVRIPPLPPFVVYLGGSVFTGLPSKAGWRARWMLGTSLSTLTDIIPNTYVVREYSDKHLIQRRMGWVNGSIELMETWESNRQSSSKNSKCIFYLNKKWLT